jgi:hypothetical protein
MRKGRVMKPPLSTEDQIGYLKTLKALTDVMEIEGSYVLVTLEGESMTHIHAHCSPADLTRSMVEIARALYMRALQECGCGTSHANDLSAHIAENVRVALDEVDAEIRLEKTSARH